MKIPFSKHKETLFPYYRYFQINKTVFSLHIKKGSSKKWTHILPRSGLTMLHSDDDNDDDDD